METRRMRIDKASLAARLRDLASDAKELAGEVEAEPESADGPRHDLEEIVEAASVPNKDHNNHRTMRIPNEVYVPLEIAAARLGVPIKNLLREIILRELPRLRTSE